MMSMPTRRRAPEAAPAEEEPHEQRIRRIRQLLAQGGTVTQHKGGMRAISHKAGFAYCTDLEWRRAVPGWPERDETVEWT